MKTISKWLIPALLLLTAGLNACGNTPKELTGAEKDAVLAWSEPLSDNLLNGFQSGDYAAFSANMSDKMKQALTEDNFKSTRASLATALGQYQGRTVKGVLEQQGVGITVVYTGQFEKDPEATITVSFESGEPHTIIGF